MTIAELKDDLDQAETEERYDECEAFERLLQAVLRSFARIQLTDSRWRDGLRDGIFRFDFQFDRSITERYRSWVFNGRSSLQQLELQEAKECRPASAEEFRRCLAEAEEILLERTQDESAALAALQDVE